MEEAITVAIRQSPIIAVFLAGLYVALSGKFFVSRREYDSAVERELEYKEIVFDLLPVTKELTAATRVAATAAANGNHRGGRPRQKPTRRRAPRRR